MRLLNEQQAKERRQSLLEISRQQEVKMATTQRERSWQALIRKEESSIKREEKLETVERINKATTY